MYGQTMRPNDRTPCAHGSDKNKDKQTKRQIGKQKDKDYFLPMNMKMTSMTGDLKNHKNFKLLDSHRDLGW